MEYNLVNIAESTWKGNDPVLMPTHITATPADLHILSYKDVGRKRLKEIKVESKSEEQLQFKREYDPASCDPASCDINCVNTKSEPSSDDNKYSSDVSYCCEHCGKLCKTFQRLKNHIEVVHRRTAEDSCERQTFQCYICDKHSVSSEGLKRHMWIHTGEKRCVCSVCGKQFSRPELLKRHSKIHTGEEPYSCSFCGKKFVFSQHLKKHIRIHTGEKPYVCQVCSRGYANSETLRKHLDTHRRL